MLHPCSGLLQSGGLLPHTDLRLHRPVRRLHPQPGRRRQMPGCGAHPRIMVPCTRHTWPLSHCMGREAFGPSQELARPTRIARTRHVRLAKLPPTVSCHCRPWKKENNFLRGSPLRGILLALCKRSQEASPVTRLAGTGMVGLPCVVARIDQASPRSLSRAPRRWVLPGAISTESVLGRSSPIPGRWPTVPYT